MSDGLAYINCSICGSLADREEAFYKAGQETGNTSLPPPARDLILVQDRTGVSSRAKQLKKCPECDTHYWYWTDYEFLVGGTEDEAFLIRLRPEQINDYLWTPPESPVEASQDISEGSEFDAASGPEGDGEQGNRQVILSKDECHELLVTYEVFLTSKVTYKTAREQRYYRWGSDHRSPEEMEKLHEAIKGASNVLSGLLARLNISETSYGDIRLPPRKKGGKRKYRGLIKWLSTGGHQGEPLIPGLAKYDYRQLLRELLSEALVKKWAFGRSLGAGAHTERGLPESTHRATIVSSHIPIPYFTGFFVVDFAKKEVRLMAIDQKTPAEEHWQLEPSADWWSRAFCCDWPIFGQ